MHNIAHIQSLSVLPPVPPPRPEGGWVQLFITTGSEGSYLCIDGIQRPVFGMYTLSNA